VTRNLKMIVEYNGANYHGWQRQNEVFNVASGHETSLKELADSLLTVIGSELPIEYAPERKVNPVSRRLADISKAQQLLGFTAHISLEEGLRRLVDWWRNEKMGAEK